MKLKKQLLLGVASLFCLTSVANANVISFVDCEYSEDYLKWVSLSDEEKKKFEEPPMCKEMKLPSLKEPSLPRKYNLKDEGRILDRIANQGVTSSCWAFASTESISSNAITAGITDVYSPLHMELFTQNTYSISGVKNFNRTANGGGNYFVAASYIMNHMGPVLESSMPFPLVSSEEEYLSYLEQKAFSATLVKPSVDVDNVVLKNADQGACSNDMILFIKNYIKNYGALAAQLYFDLGGTHPTRTLAGENTYKISNDYVNGAYYYYNGSNISNHGVTIVGYDDDVAIDSFSSYNQPSRKGAFIVKNSYGESTKAGDDNILQGDHGYYYVSYDDVNICTSLVGFYDVDTTVSDYSYYYDYLGWNGVLSSAHDFVYLANKFDKQSESSEKLDKIVFGTALAGQKYEVYYSSTGSLNSYAKLGEGTTHNRGYESFTVPENIVIGDHFSIIIKLFKGDEADLSIVAASGVNDSHSHYYQYDIKEDVSYLSNDGANWTNLKVSQVNLQNSIKVFTSKVEASSITPTTIDEQTTTPTSDEPIIEVTPNDKNDEPIPDYVHNPDEDLQNDVHPSHETGSKNEEEDEIENPNTGAFLSLTMVGFVLVLSLIIFVQVKKKQKLFKM